MHNQDPQTIEEVRDPVGRRYWPANKGRDGERTPMQWDGASGFSRGKPWLPMGRDALRAAISEPVRAAGLMEFEPGLVDRVVDDALLAPGQLPLAQFALTLLWQRQRGGVLTHDAYTQLGQVAGAIAEYADAVYTHDLDGAAERDAARRLLVRTQRGRVATKFFGPVSYVGLTEAIAKLLARAPA